MNSYQAGQSALVPLLKVKQEYLPKDATAGRSRRPPSPGS